MNELITLIKRYNLEKEVLKWAGAFRFLHATQPDGFGVEKWIELNSPMDINLANTLVRILENENEISLNNSIIRINNESNFQRMFELIDFIVKYDFTEVQEKKVDLLWTIPHQLVSALPLDITSEYNYLYSWIQEIILSSCERIVFIAPYFSESGIRQLITSIRAINDFKEGMIIDFLVNDIQEVNNSRAFTFLKASLQLKNNNKIRIFEPKEKEDNKLWFHAKLLLVDNKRGYLGSANYSGRGMSSQFELGVPLTEHQTKSLFKLIDFWIFKEYFKSIPYCNNHN